MITAIVITRNEEKNIARALKSLIDPRISQIIVSDSNSSDATSEVVKALSFGDNRIKFVSYNSPPFTAARGRNEGAKLAEASSKFLLFIDGDMEFMPSFLDVAFSAFEKTESLSAVAGQMHNFYHDDGGVITKREFDYYCVQDGAPGGAVLFRANDFYSVNGYNEHLIVNEEAELFYRLSKLGRNFLRIDELMVVHHTEIPVSKSRIKERLFDKKITALSKNFLVGIRDLNYMRLLLRDNRYTFISAVALVVSLVLIFLWPWLSLATLVCCYTYTSVRCRDARVGLNYLVYGVGLLSGLLSASLRSLFRRA